MRCRRSRFFVAQKAHVTQRAEPFGGIFLILVGDVHQKPPPAGRPWAFDLVVAAGSTRRG